MTDSRPSAPDTNGQAPSTSDTWVSPERKSLPAAGRSKAIDWAEISRLQTTFDVSNAPSALRATASGFGSASDQRWTM